MTSRLREILTASEMETFERTGYLYDDTPRVVEKREANGWGGMGFRVIPTVARRESWQGEPINPLKSLAEMYPRQQSRFGVAPATVSPCRLIPTPVKVAGCAVVSGEDQGFCYLKLVRDELKLSVAVTLGEWPSLKRLLSLPQTVFLGKDVLSVLTCAVSKNKLHVSSQRRGGEGNEVNFLSILAGLSDDAIPEWVSEILFGEPQDSTCFEVSDAWLIGGSETVVSKEVRVGKSYELLFRYGVRERVCDSLGDVSSLSQVFAFPPQFYVSNLVEMGFCVNRGFLKFTAPGQGIRLFVLMRMMLNELADLKMYPILRVVKSAKAGMLDLGLKLGDSSSEVQFPLEVSVQRRNVTAGRTVARLKEFEDRSVFSTVQGQIAWLTSLGVSLEDCGERVVWGLVSAILRGGVVSSLSDSTLMHYDKYANLFNSWAESVFHGHALYKLLTQYGVRASYVVRVVQDILAFLGVSKMGLVSLEGTGFVVEVAEYRVYIPVTHPWPQELPSVASQFCMVCGLQHYVLRLGGQIVCVSERVDMLLVSLEECVQKACLQYGPVRI